MSDVDQLLSADGQQLLDWLSGQLVTPDLALSLAEQLRGRYAASLIATALTQQSLRIAGRAKFSLADRMLFTRAGLEQASSEQTASHSAGRLRGLGAVADLCCGIGGNLIALAAGGEQVLAADTDRTTLRFAAWNAAVYGRGSVVRPVCADVQELRLDRGRPHGPVDAVFVDPARRSDGRRLRAGTCEPPLEWCFSLTTTVPSVAIKAAPGLPHDLVPSGWETEFVAVGRDLKEAILWSPALATTRRRATILPAGDTLVGRPGATVPVRDPGAFLLDPSPAVTRAGLVQELARELGAWQIDPMIAFLSVDLQVSTPFARTLRVLESMPWHERNAARRLRELGMGSVDIRRRGLAGDVRQIHSRLGLRGASRGTVVLTRHEGKPWCLICADVSSADHGCAWP